MKKTIRTQHPFFSIICGIWVLSVLMLLLPYKIHAQSRSAYATVKGVVVEKENLTVPVDFATVQLLPSGMWTATDSKGNFSFDRVAPGRVELVVQFVGMSRIDTTFMVQAGATLQVTLEMEYSTFRLDEVQVVAQESKAGQSTASTITRQTMDHLRTISVADVLSLLPGGEVSRTNMSTTQIPNIRGIRQLSTQGESSNPEVHTMNAMGTLVVVDGAPLSNNANLQAINPVMGGSVVTVGESNTFNVGINSGVDLRGISVDNIESMEVIRGVASAAFGDLTSGAIVIRSKAGKEPLKINFKTDPRVYSISASKGMQLGEKAGSLNLSADYAYSVNRLYESYQFYERSTVKALYSNVFGKLSSNTSLDLNFGKDTRKWNPDDAASRIASSGSSLGFRFNTNGTFNNLNWGALNNIRYTLSGSYTDKKSHDEGTENNATAGYSINMTDGAIITNIPGQKVYDIYGNELTSIPPAEMGSFFRVLPNSYFSAYDILGKEVNVFANLTANLSKSFGNLHNRVRIGIDYKLDGNLGEGKVYDINNPPRRTGPDNSSVRPRKFSDIPFMHQLSAFIEENMSWHIGERDLTLQAGLRYDRFNSKQILTPRINAGFTIIPKTLSIRAGYGVMAKAPTASYLYPDRAYFDFVHYNTIDRVGTPVQEQLLMGSTRVFDATNPDLKIASTTTYELGFDLTIKKMRFSVTAFDRTLHNGYRLSAELDNYKLIEYKQYVEGENRPGQIPLLAEGTTSKVFEWYYSPSNSGRSHDRGVEYDFNLGRFNQIRTSFVVSGAYMRSTDWSDNYTYVSTRNGNSLERNIGVYEKGVMKYEYERLNTTIRATHNIPQIGFVVTLATQITWMNKVWETYGNDTMFEKYISREDGKVYDFNPAMKEDPEFRYLFSEKNDNRFIGESWFPTVIFNLTLTKEITSIVRASFNVSNMFNQRPLYESKRNPGVMSQLNIPIYFGFELGITLK